MPSCNFPLASAVNAHEMNWALRGAVHAACHLLKLTWIYQQLMLQREQQQQQQQQQLGLSSHICCAK